MPTSFQYEPVVAASAVDLTVAGLHSLANNGFVTLAEYDNEAAANRYLWADFEFLGKFAAAPTAGNTWDVYILIAPDGTNYTATDGPPPNAFVGQIVLQAVDNIRYHAKNIPIPPRKFKLYLKNASGQATSASGSAVKMWPTRTKTV